MTSLVSSELDSTFAKSFAHGINRIAVNEVQKFTAYSDVDMNVTVVQGPEIVFSHNFTSLNEKIRPTDRVRGLVFSLMGTIFMSQQVIVFGQSILPPGI